MSTLAIQPITADAAFLDDLNAARREALAVLRNVLASLIPKPGSPPPASLALLREARLAACDVLALKLPAAPDPQPAPPDTPPSSPPRSADPMAKIAAAQSVRSAVSNPIPIAPLASAAPSTSGHANPAPPSPLTRSRATAPVQALLSRLGVPP